MKKLERRNWRSEWETEDSDLREEVVLYDDKDQNMIPSVENWLKWKQNWSKDVMFRNDEVQRTIGTGLASSPWAVNLSIYTPFCCPHVSALFLDDLIQSLASSLASLERARLN